MSGEARNSEHIIDAYGRAWSRRVEGGDNSLELFRSEVGSAKDGVDEEQWKLYSGLWEKGVPPSKLAKELRRAGLRSLREVVGHTFRLWRSSVREPRWMKEPSDVELLGQDSQYWSLPVTELPLSIGDEEYPWLERACAESQLEEGEEFHVFAIWLDPLESQVDECAVVLGRQRVGSTRVSTDVWHELRGLQSRRIFANGALEINPNETPLSPYLGVQLPPPHASS